MHYISVDILIVLTINEPKRGGNYMVYSCQKGYKSRTGDDKNTKQKIILVSSTNLFPTRQFHYSLSPRVDELSLY